MRVRESVREAFEEIVGEDKGQVEKAAVTAAKFFVAVANGEPRPGTPRDATPPTPERWAKQATDIFKYRQYLPEADTLAEAQEMAPEEYQDAVVETENESFYYEVEPGGGGGDTDDTDGEPSIFDSPIDTGGYDVADEWPSEGERAYIEHPNGDYIIDVLEVREDGPNGERALIWETSGGSERYIDSTTTSELQGVVVDEPELGPSDNVYDVNGVSDVDSGDVVMYEDPGGNQMFARVDHTSGGNVHLENGSTEDVGDINGKVVNENPAEMYDVDTDFGIDFATAVAEGWFGNPHTEEQSFPVQKTQLGVGEVEDSDLILEALELEKEKRNSTALVERLESRLRALGVEPPQPPDYNPEEVPESREGTVFDGIESRGAVRAVGHVIHNYSKKKANYEDWNEFLDTLTQDEIREGLMQFIDTEPDTGYSHNQPLAFEAGKHPYDEDKESGTTWIDVGKLAPLMSRADKDTLMDVYEDVKENKDMGIKDRFEEAAQVYAKDADARLEMMKETKNMPRAAEMQIEEDFDSFADMFFSEWTSHSEGYSAAQVLIDSMDINDGKPLTNYVHGRPVASIETTDTFKENIERVREETKEYWETRLDDEKPGYVPIDEDNITEDGNVRVYRGVSKEVTSHSPASSWSIDLDTAKSFNGHAVLEAEVEPGDWLADKWVGKAKDWGEVGYGSEDEFVVLGGAFS